MENAAPPQGMLEALDQLIDLEKEGSVCERFQALINMLAFFAHEHPQHRAMCATIRTEMVKQHRAFHLLRDGIVSEARKRGGTHGENDGAG